MRTQIKFCGINKQADLDYAIELSVDAVGLVFIDVSPRYVDIDTAQALSHKANKPIKVVGLFMDANHDFVTRVAKQVNMDYIQFHGTESPEFCSSFSLPYIKAIPMADSVQAGEMIVAHRNTADILLLDGHRAGESGGKGVTFDWSDLPKLDTTIFIAGGLTPDNVEQAITQCRPQGVDVSSGIESAVGVKDHAKMKAFVDTVANADYNH